MSFENFGNSGLYKVWPWQLVKYITDNYCKWHQALSVFDILHLADNICGAMKMKNCKVPSFEINLHGEVALVLDDLNQLIAQSLTAAPDQWRS